VITSGHTSVYTGAYTDRTTTTNSSLATVVQREIYLTKADPNSFVAPVNEEDKYI